MVVIEDRIRPGRVWYALGACAIVLGLVAGVLLIVSSINTMPSFTTTIEADVTTPVPIDKAGEWSVYAGRPGGLDSDGKGSCMIRPPDGAGRPQTGQPNGKVSFTRDSYQWYWLFTFTVDTPGTYELTCKGVGNVDRFAVGKSPNTAGFVGLLVGGILTLLAGLGIGLPLIIVTAVRRSGARRRLRLGVVPGGPPGQPGFVGQQGPFGQ